MTATGPPQTQPKALNDEWVNNNIPGSIPSFLKSAVSEAMVTGASLLFMELISDTAQTFWRRFGQHYIIVGIAVGKGPYLYKPVNY